MCPKADEPFSSRHQEAKRMVTSELPCETCTGTYFVQQKRHNPLWRMALSLSDFSQLDAQTQLIAQKKQAEQGSINCIVRFSAGI